MKGYLIMKAETNYHILIYVTTLMLIYIYDLNRTVTVSDHKGSKEELMMKALIDIYPRMRKKVVLSPPYFFFDYKNVALFVLRAVLSCLQKCPMLINSLFYQLLCLRPNFPYQRKKKNLTELQYRI